LLFAEPFQQRSGPDEEVGAGRTISQVEEIKEIKDGGQ